MQRKYNGNVLLQGARSLTPLLHMALAKYKGMSRKGIRKRTEVFIWLMLKVVKYWQTT